MAPAPARAPPLLSGHTTTQPSSLEEEGVTLRRARR